MREEKMKCWATETVAAQVSGQGDHHEHQDGGGGRLRADAGHYAGSGDLFTIETTLTGTPMSCRLARRLILDLKMRLVPALRRLRGLKRLEPPFRGS